MVKAIKSVCILFLISFRRSVFWTFEWDMGETFQDSMDSSALGK